MNEDEVTTIAQKHIEAKNQASWRYELGIPKRDAKRPTEWNVLVRWMFEDGTPLDGPGIIIVDESSKEARFF